MGKYECHDVEHGWPQRGMKDSTCVLDVYHGVAMDSHGLKAGAA